MESVVQGATVCSWGPCCLCLWCWAAAWTSISFHPYFSHDYEVIKSNPMHVRVSKITFNIPIHCKIMSVGFGSAEDSFS